VEFSLRRSTNVTTDPIRSINFFKLDGIPTVIAELESQSERQTEIKICAVIVLAYLAFFGFHEYKHVVYCSSLVSTGAVEFVIHMVYIVK
jgi:hypothetical protein